jgi:hypothetical protein
MSEMIASYFKAESVLGKRESRKVANNTYLHTAYNWTCPGGGVAGGCKCIAVRLHNTDVVTFHVNGAIILNTNGWWTVTSKDRLNRFSPAYVSSNRGVWTVSYGGLSCRYFDGMNLDDMPQYVKRDEDEDIAARAARKAELHDIRSAAAKRAAATRRENDARADALYNDAAWNQLSL